MPKKLIWTFKCDILFIDLVHQLHKNVFVQSVYYIFIWMESHD